MGNLFLNYLYFKIIFRLLLYLRKHKKSMFTQCILSLFFVLLNASPPLLCAFIHCNKRCAFVFRNSPISPILRTHNRSLKNLGRILSTQRNTWYLPINQHTVKTIPFSQFLRSGCICSQDEDFGVRCSEMSQHLRERAYPQNTITSALNESSKYLPPKHWQTNPKIARTVFLSLSPIISQPTVQTMV